MAQRRGARGNQQTPGLTVSAVEFYHIRGMEFAFKLRAILAHARQVQGNRILFYISGHPVQGNPFLTDSQGIAITPSIVLALQKGATDVEIMAQLENTQTAGLDRLPIPWPGRQQPKNSEQEALELERVQLDRAKLAHELDELKKQPSSLQKDLDEIKLKLEISKLSLQIKELEKQPSTLEKEVAEAELQVKKAEAEKRIAEATKSEPPKTEKELLEEQLAVARAKSDLNDFISEKSKFQILKLEPISVVPATETIIISMARVDETGKGIAGKIFYTDPAKPTEIQKQDADKDGIAVVTVSLGETKRTVIFFLPEKPTEKLEIEIPAKGTNRVKKVTPTMRPRKGLLAIFKKASEHGREEIKQKYKRREK